MRVSTDQSGFTLVELLTAIVIGAFFTGAVSTLLVNSAKIAQRSRDVAVVNSFAENKIESLRSIGYLGLNITDPPTNISSELPIELRTPRNATLDINQYSISIKQAVLSIEYNDQGAQKIYSYTTLIGELGVGQY